MNGQPARPRRGLVLGGGGVLGAAWMVGALKALEEEHVISTRPKEVLIQDPEGLEEILHGVR